MSLSVRECYYGDWGLKSEEDKKNKKDETGKG